MNIILIGFMGTGKSDIGRRLAERLSMHFLDTDTLIEKTEKIKISDIFAKKGEAYFRDLETKIIKTLEDYDNFVISTGGGMILRDENVTMLKKLGSIVLLWSEPDVIIDRLKHAKDRPLIEVDRENKIRELLEKRRTIYHSVCDHKIDTSTLSLDQAAEEIIRWVKE